MNRKGFTSLPMTLMNGPRVWLGIKVMSQPKIYENLKQVESVPYIFYSVNFTLHKSFKLSDWLNFFYKMGHSRPPFLYFRLSTVNKCSLKVFF